MNRMDTHSPAEDADLTSPCPTQLALLAVVCALAAGHSPAARGDLTRPNTTTLTAAAGRQDEKPVAQVLRGQMYGVPFESSLLFSPATPRANPARARTPKALLSSIPLLTMLQLSVRSRIAVPMEMRAKDALPGRTLWSDSRISEPLSFMSASAPGAATGNPSVLTALLRPQSDLHPVSNAALETPTTRPARTVAAKALATAHPSKPSPRLSYNTTTIWRSSGRLTSLGRLAQTSAVDLPLLTALPLAMPKSRITFPLDETLQGTPASGALVWFSNHALRNRAMQPHTRTGRILLVQATAGGTGATRSADLALSDLPPATVSPQALPPGSKLPDLSSMRKIIKGAALQKPPAAYPLSAEQNARAVPADMPTLAQLLPPLPGLPRPTTSGQLAQNPNAPPLQQPMRPVSAAAISNQIEVATGTFVVLQTPSDLQTVAIADPAIADVVVVNARAVLVNGKGSGTTSLVIVDRTKIRQYLVRVRPLVEVVDPSQVAGVVQNAISESGMADVRVRALKADALVLEGTVATEEEKLRAAEIAGVFAPKIINSLKVPPPPAPEPTPTPLPVPTAVPTPTPIPLATQVQSDINIPGVTTRMIGDTIILEGTVATDAERLDAETLAKIRAPKVLNRLKLPTLTPEQVQAMLGSTSPEGDGTDAALSLIPSPQITVRRGDNQIILEGTVATPGEIISAGTVAARTGLSVDNRLRVLPAPSADATMLAGIETAINRAISHSVKSSGTVVRASGTPKRIVLTGVVPDTNVAVLAEQVARGFATEVDNMLMTPNPLLVDVDVSILEINKTKLRNLGITYTSLLDSTANPVGFVFGQSPQSGTPGGVTEPVGNRSFTFLSPFLASIRALVDTGNARLLSNPHTTVLSGRTATFQVGGQVPIPGNTTIGLGGVATQTITFKDFGVLVDVVPNASPDGVITLRLRTEVSQPDFTNGVIPPGGGSAIPGFSRRSAVTELTVKPNGTIGLAGLIQNNVTELVRKLPVLGNIPVLGSLFTSRRFQRSETELVIFVTPRLLPNPLSGGRLAPAAPIPVGNTTNIATTTGNPGIASFNTGSTFSTAGGGAPGGGAGGGGGGP